MAEDVAELETRPIEPKRNEKPDLAPARSKDDQSQQSDEKSKRREVQELDKLPKPLPRWPLVLAGLVIVGNSIRLVSAVESGDALGS